MSLSLIRRIFLLLLAVLVTAGMGLSAVQANTMNMNTMDMGAGMVMTGAAKCNDCGSSTESKGMTACTAPACTAQVATEAPLVLALDMVFAPVRHSIFSRILLGRDTVPDPYPPRTSAIG